MFLCEFKLTDPASSYSQQNCDHFIYYFFFLLGIENNGAWNGLIFKPFQGISGNTVL